MAAQMQSVISSRVNQIGWDPDTGQLVVVWSSGKTSVYDAVAAETAHQVISSPSIGSALNDLVIGRHEHNYG